MKQLKMKSLKTNIVVIIIVWIVAAVILGVGLKSLITAFQKPTPIEDVDFTKDVEGLYVSGTIYGIYGCYCEETSGSSVVAREYVIDADDYYFLGLRAEYDDMDAADALEEASWDYLEDEDADYSKLEAYQYEVKGTIKAMPSDSLRYYHEAIGWYSLTDEEQEMYLPYYLEIGTYGSYDTMDLVIMILLFLFFFLCGLIPLIMALTGHYQKSIKQYVARSASPELALQKVEDFLANTPEKDGLRYNQDFICGSMGSTTILGETPKLCWAYLQTTNHKQYFITVSRSYALMLCFTDGSVQSVSVKNENVAREHLYNLEQLCPQTIFGYSDDLSSLFRNNLYGFLNLRYNQNQPNNFSFEK